MTAFAEFFDAIHGYAPYPWQAAFAEAAVSGPPPSLVRAPTGSGKTGVLDALVWALSQQAGRPARERSVGVRIVWAIDRRILVDEVNEHAVRLAGRLEAALEDRADRLSEVAAALASISGGRPLATARWRGGIERDRSTIAPDQPLIITSTVGQIGSRMLFRGYGISDRSLALEAGLAACDTTVCLDEAHLAEPFAQTASWIAQNRTGASTAFEAPPFDVVTLTATPSAQSDDQITIGPADEAALGSRLTGRKVATLDDSPGNDAERVRALAGHTVAHVEAGAKRVVCIVNTVRRARAVFERLTLIGEKDGFDTALLIGPQRPVDRAAAIRRVRAILEGRDGDAPVVCVATQTFEVGIDADADAMVTESASAAALTQRFGRLNRSGSGEGVATIVRDTTSWLYEGDEPAAWKWLESRADANGTIDISVMTLDRDDTRPEPARAALAPQLEEGVVRLLTQTSPRPRGFQEPDIETFLRGPDSTIDSDVTVCWRSDLHPGIRGEAAFLYRQALLTLAPPQPEEQLTLSVSAARGLIRARCTADTKDARAGAAQALAESDVEGRSKPDTRPARDRSANFSVPYCVIRGDEIREGSLSSRSGAHGRELVRPRDLKPGDIVVLASEIGGVDDHGLAPGSAGSAGKDVAWDRRPEPDIDQEGSTVRALRLSRAALGLPKSADGGDDAWDRFVGSLPAISSGTFAAPARGAIKEAIGPLSENLPDREALSVVAAMEPDDPRLVLRAVGSPTVRPEEMVSSPASGRTADDLPDDAAFVLQVAKGRADLTDRTSVSPPPTIEEHAASVAARVDAYSRHLGLDPVTAGSLNLAARAHDHGKADPRVQAFFHRGVSPLGAPPVAKSEFGTDDPATSRAAARLAGLPSGLRHEIASAAILTMAISEGSVSGEFDPDLALHLVRSHHGQAHPLPRLPLGGAPAARFECTAAGVSGAASGDGIEGWTDGTQLMRFWDVVERYGPWGTAYLEAILMLADRTVSAEGN